MGLTAVVRDSAPLRCAPRGEPLTEKNRRKAHNPLDYPHRRCSAWLANQPLRKRSNDATSWNRHRIAYQMLACPALQEATCFNTLSALRGSGRLVVDALSTPGHPTRTLCTLMPHSPH